MQNRYVYLANNKTMTIDIFDGYKDFNTLVNLLGSYNMNPEDYYVIKFCNMLYAFFYNDWNELVVGIDSLYYLNPDYHICRRKANNGHFEWPYEREEVEDRCVPKWSVYGIYEDLSRIDKTIAIYYYENNKWNIMNANTRFEDLKKIICQFGRQFYRSFFFSRIEANMYLGKYFDRSFLALLDQFYVNGAFRVNPFTWKATIDATNNSTYCAFFDTIMKKPICDIGGKSYDFVNYGYDF